MAQKLSTRIIEAIAAALFLFNVGAWVTGAMSPDAAIFSQNLLWTLTSLAIGILYLVRMRDATGEAKWLMTGIAFVAIGTAVHRGYYSAWRWFRENGYEQIQQQQIEIAWILTVPIGIALVGYAFHARPVLERFVGNDWLALFLSALVIVWSVFVWFLA